jgi:hypothetical protein
MSPKWSLPFRFSVWNVVWIPRSSMHSTRHAHLILVYFFTFMISDEKYKLWNPLLCHFLQPPVPVVSVVLKNSQSMGPFANFVDSPYYSESELYGGAVTVSLSKYLPWQAMHFLEHSTHFSKTCCRPLFSSKFLALEFPFHSWKSPAISWLEKPRNLMGQDLNWILCSGWRSGLVELH